MADAPHQPVLVREVVELLSGADTVVDMTVGTGGHAAALLDAGVGRVIGIDRDTEALGEAAERLSSFGDRFRPAPARFSQVHQVAREAGVTEAGGVLYDLGVSSLQLDRPDRGFSYRGEGPLDMRMGDGPSATDVVNTYSEEELVRVIGELGEERFAGRIARAILRARSRSPIRTTRELAAVVAAAVPKRRGGPHPARRTFQAIRIEVNREIEELTASLPRAVQLLAPGGRVVVIAYHSLEDRVVKRFFRDDEALEVLTRKPVRPSAGERDRNPRARSAKLRAAERRAA
ncbi:MAG TPA: 16S rRNA (cytosine(1402)-N(4))-methyltransferase RsmH [Actinomycetota bacterium]|nr:16S rRNA (cytosine(1402)-N(4))-methyltransferase RsmH [Actinomycetota bacterium]